MNRTTPNRNTSNAAIALAMASALLWGMPAEAKTPEEECVMYAAAVHGLVDIHQTSGLTEAEVLGPLTRGLNEEAQERMRSLVAYVWTLPRYSTEREQMEARVEAGVFVYTVCMNGQS